jgi:hypothetical protein
VIRVLYRITPALLVATLVTPMLAGAQATLGTARLGVSVPRPAADSLTYARRLAALAPAGGAAPTDADEPRRSDRSFQAIVGVGTGLLVGGFLGYFVSQVGTSDWENRTAGERSQMRRQFAISGAGIGAVTGYFMRPRKLRLGGQPIAPPLPSRAGRQLLSSADLRRSLATNMLEAIELERPEWLQALPRPLEIPASDTASAPSRSLVVYLGTDRVGGVASLRDVSLSEVQELRLYDAREAEQKWGVEHRYGAIEVITPTSAQTEPTATRAPAASSP